jgi:hypothetical protein
MRKNKVIYRISFRFLDENLKPMISKRILLNLFAFYERK